MLIKKKIFNLLKLYKQQGIDTSLSSLCQFSCSNSTIGFHLLMSKIYSGNYNIKYYQELIKRIFIANKIKDLKIVKNKKFREINKSKTKIFISWAVKSDFDNKGNFIDRYTNIKSNKFSNTIFLLIFLNKELSKKIKENIVLFKLELRSIIFSFFYFPISIIKFLINNNFNFTRVIHYYNFSSNFALLFYRKFQENFLMFKIEKVFFPYEGQPF